MIYKFEDVAVDDHLFEVRRGGSHVRLEKRVFEILLLLIRNRSRVVSKSEIFEKVWDARRVSEASLTVAMTALRRGLADSFDSPRIIETHRGRGYRFVASVLEVAAPGDASRVSVRDRFVGRAVELAELSTALTLARKEKRQTCLISGEPGIGKTRLAEEFCRRSSALGVPCVSSRCLEEDGAPAFWPWIQVLRNLEEVRSRATWPDALRTEIRRLLPEGPEAPGVDEMAHLDPGRTRFRLFDAVATVIKDSAETCGLVIFIDDIHRSDIASLLLLEFVVAQLRSSPIMFLLGERDAETRRSSTHREALARICRVSGTRVLSLSGLGSAEIEELVEGTGHSAKVDADHLRNLTGGNPFFLSQITPLLGAKSAARDRLPEPLPSTVREAIVRQLEGVSPSAQDTLTKAAVIGREFSERILAIVRSDPNATAIHLDEAVSAGLLEPSKAEGMFQFRHVLLRDVLHDRLPLRERASTHWKVANAIEQVFGPRASARFPEIAFHRFSGVVEGDPIAALQCCRRVGEAASGRLAYEEAALQFSRALELATAHASRDLILQCDIYLALGAEQARSGDRDGAVESYSAAADLARTAADGGRFSAAALGSFPGFFAVEAGAPDARAIGLLREAIELVGRDDLEGRALLLSRLAMALAWLEEGGERESLCREAWALACEVGSSRLKHQVLLARWFAEWEPANFDQRWAIADELMLQSAQYADRETALLCRLFHVTCVMERGDLVEFRRQVGVFEDAAGKLRQPEALWYAALLRAMYALHTGKLHEAEALSTRFAEIGSLVRDANVFHSRTTHRVILAWELGALDEMVDAASDGCEAYPGMYGWHASRAWALGRAGRVGECKRELEILFKDGVSGIPRRMDWAVTMAMASEACVRVGDAGRSKELFEVLLPMRGRVIVLGLCVATWGCASRYLGKLAAALGRRLEAVVLLREAVEVDEQIGAAAWAAWSRFELAEVLHDGGGPGERAESVQLFDAALGEARRLRLRWLEESIARRAM